MSFETEVLQLCPLVWKEPAHGLLLTDGQLLRAPDENVAALLRDLAKMQEQSPTGMSLQQVVLQLRRRGASPWLQTVRLAVEFLVDNRLLYNPSAGQWVKLLKHEPASVSAADRIKLWLFRCKGKRRFQRDQLAGLPMLRQLDANTQEQMLKYASVRIYGRGARICRQGAHDRQLMILLSGQANVIRRASGAANRVVAVLQPMAVFGEIGFFLNEPRSADVVALEDCEILCIPPPANGSSTDLGRFKSLQVRLWFLQALLRNPLFADTPSEAFDALLVHGHEKRFEPGERLVAEGEAGEACYFVIQGRVQVTQAGREISRLTSGSIIGEVSLFFKTGGRTATVTAETQVLTVCYDIREFWEMLSRHLVLGLALEGLAEKRLARDEARNASD